MATSHTRAAPATNDLLNIFAPPKIPWVPTVPARERLHRELWSLKFRDCPNCRPSPASQAFCRSDVFQVKFRGFWRFADAGHVSECTAGKKCPEAGRADLAFTDMPMHVVARPQRNLGIVEVQYSNSFETDMLVSLGKHARDAF